MEESAVGSVGSGSGLQSVGGAGGREVTAQNVPNERDISEGVCPLQTRQDELHRWDLRPLRVLSRVERRR